MHWLKALMAGGMIAAAGAVVAQTFPSFGAGSAVTQIDRIATFDLLDTAHNGTSLSTYTEGGLDIFTSGDSFCGDGSMPYFDPFHVPGVPHPQGFYYPVGGNNEWVLISTTSHATIYAVELLYGNGWTTGDVNGVPWGNSNAWLDWQTLRDGNVVSSGQIGPDPQLPVGTVVGFTDALGFDELQLRCRIAASPDPTLQALALDDLKVQLTPVPEPASAAVVAVGALLALSRRRKV